jgi:hypothetical protein
MLSELSAGTTVADLTSTMTFKTARPYPIEPGPEQAVQRCKPRTTGLLATQDRQLMT